MKLALFFLITFAAASLVTIAINAGIWMAIAIFSLCNSTGILIVWGLVYLVKTTGTPFEVDVDRPAP